MSVSGDILDEGDARAAVAMRDSLQGMGERKGKDGRGGGSSRQSSSAVISGSGAGFGSGGGGIGVGGDNNSSVVISEADLADDNVTRASQDASGQGLGLGGVAGAGSGSGSVGTTKGLLARNEVPFAILGKQANLLFVDE